MIQKYFIGRDYDNQIVIDHPYVSGHHGELLVSTENGYTQCTYTDHSTNGTWINGQMLHNTSCLVAFGDNIMFPGNVPFDWNQLQTANFVQPHSNTVLQTPDAAQQRFDKPVFPSSSSDDPCEDTKNLGFSAAFKRFFKHYADFSGRARRREYWYVILWQAIIGAAVSVLLIFSGIIFGAGAIGDSLDAIASGGAMYIILIILYGLYNLGTIVPSLALTVRRIHDTGKSGWWYFMSCIPLVGFVFPLIWSFSDSEPGSNKWGPCPK